MDLKALTDDTSEFLVTPKTAIRMTNTSQSQVLLIYTVLPISDKKSWFVSQEEWAANSEVPFADDESVAKKARAD